MDLMHKEVPWKCISQEGEAFVAFKWALTEAAALLFPNFVHPFYLETNALDVGMGAVQT